MLNRIINQSKFNQRIFCALQTSSRLFSTAGSIRSQVFIEGDELESLLHSQPSDLKIVNGTWYLPPEGINAADKHLEQRITKDAVHFDHDVIVEPGIDLPHTMPSLEVFRSHMIRLGIQRNHQIVCYDQHSFGCTAVARCAWMLKFYGATNVRILNGGLKKWVADGRPYVVDNTPMSDVTYDEKDGDYAYHVVDPKRVIMDINEIYELAGKLYHAESATSLDYQIIDARSKGRFEGTVPEPRPGLRSGSMKNTLNLPFPELSNEDGTFKNDEDILKKFNDVGISVDKHTIGTCGSGTTSCVVELALRLLGNNTVQVYDGSWSEYGKGEEPRY